MITLTTLPKATPMEVFLQARDHLLSQNKRSAIGPSCKYRLGELKCAAGCFISDEEYTCDMEDNDWDTLVAKGYVTSSHKELISTLQNIHDACELSEWAAELDILEIEVMNGDFN